MNEYTCTMYSAHAQFTKKKNYQASVRHQIRRKGSLVHVTPVLSQKTWNIANRLRCNSMGSGYNNVTLG